MRVLIVATNATPPGLSDDVRAGRHRRVDYLELVQRFGTTHHDYNALRSPGLLQWFEDLSRFDIRQALAVAHLIWRSVADMMQW